MQVVQRQRARAIGLSDSGQHADALKSAARSRGSAALQAGRAARFRGSPQVGQSSLVGQGMEVPLEQGVTLVFRCVPRPLRNLFQIPRPRATRSQARLLTY